MKRTISIVCIILCFATAFAGSVSFNFGFSILGANAATAVRVSDSVRIGAAVSMAKQANNDSFGWLFAQGIIAVDLIPNLNNDLELKFGLSYLNIKGNDGYTEEDTEIQPSTMKFAGLTVGLQYTHWFGSSRTHGIFVGFDLPAGGYVKRRENGDLVEDGPFIGPLTSLATLGVLASSFRTGYALQF